MEEPKVKERFIPLRQSEILEHIIAEGLLSGNEKKKFRDFSRILKSVFHYESLSTLDSLKDTYYPFNPDPSTSTRLDFPEDRRKFMEEKFIMEFENLLDQANFERLTEEELSYAFTEDSDLAVNVEVDMNDFSHMHLFRRGESRVTIKVPFLGIFKRKKEFEVYDRLVMLVKFREDYHRKKSTLGMEIDTSRVYLKYFKNVPKQDLEMIFPDPRIQMKAADKIKISIPLIAGTALSGAKVGNLIGGGSAGLTYTMALVGGLLGYMIKSAISYRHTVIKYVKTLTQGLYFKNLDNNSGVFHIVMSEAEEEEVKEALLGYYFLLKKGSTDQKTLDARVEEWFARKFSIMMDFEVDDALGKLERLELASRDAAGRWAVLSLEKAMERLDELWDNYFTYNVEPAMQAAAPKPASPPSPAPPPRPPEPAPAASPSAGAAPGSSPEPAAESFFRSPTPPPPPQPMEPEAEPLVMPSPPPPPQTLEPDPEPPVIHPPPTELPGQIEAGEPPRPGMERKKLPDDEF